MFHMLSCFNLQPDTSLDEFRQCLDDFASQLEGTELIDNIGPIGRRQRHPIMDTDDERNHEFFLIMSFRNRAQCDRAVESIFKDDESENSSHKSVYKLVSDPVFICWEDT